MSRPRKVSDEEVFAAAMRVMAYAAPAQLRLADIAAEAGVTAGALVQRFGSKRDLLLAMMETWAGSTESMFEALREGHTSPLDAVRAYADGMAQMGDGAGGVAHHLGWLQLDLGDAAFHGHAQAGARATRRELGVLLDTAVRRGELRRGTDVLALARAVEVTVGGSLLAWAFHQEGSARLSMRQDLRAALDPHLTVAGRRALEGGKPGKGKARGGAGGSYSPTPTTHPPGIPPGVV
jgi:AcrR family transcriptional regulator